MVANALGLTDISDNEFSPQTNGEISDSITQNWTEQAIECYKLRCDCSNCSVSQGNYSFVCQMPKVLDALMKSLGKPISKDNPKLQVVK